MFLKFLRIKNSRLRQWHRWVGLAAAVFVLMLSVTGILINHAHTLGLDQRKIQSSFLLHWYGLESRQPVLGIRLSNGTLARTGHQLFFLNDGADNAEPLGECPEPYFLAAESSSMVVVVCGGNRLYLLTPQGVFLEEVSELPGMKHDVEGVWSQNENFYLRAAGKYWQFDPDTLAINPVDPSVLSGEWTERRVNPLTAEENPLPRLPVDHDITYERVLLDLHSGRFWGGSAGILLMDMAALAMVFLAISGVAYWWKTRRR